MLPTKPVEMEDIENMLSMEMYKIQKTFEGDISLRDDQRGTYEQGEPGSGGGKIEEKDPLDEIIEQINELYNGQFTDADRVIITILLDKLSKDPNLTKLAQTSELKIFLESIFPQIFGETAQNGYMESQETWQSLFLDQEKYNVIMGVIARMLYYNCTIHETTANVIKCLPEKHVKFAEELARGGFLRSTGAVPDWFSAYLPARLTALFRC